MFEIKKKAAEFSAAFLCLFKKFLSPRYANVSLVLPQLAELCSINYSDGNSRLKVAPLPELLSAHTCPK